MSLNELHQNCIFAHFNITLSCFYFCGIRGLRWVDPNADELISNEDSITPLLYADSTTQHLSVSFQTITRAHGS